MNALDQLLAEISGRDALRSEGTLSDWILRAELELVSWDTFPPVLYETLLNFFVTNNFVLRDGSWQLLHLLQNNHDLMTSAQKEQLVLLLVEFFPKFKDWMVAFVAAEIIGSWYAGSDRDLGVFEELLAKTQLEIVPCIPHAIETVARETHSEVVRSQAVKLLEALTAHPVELVRREAAISLEKVRRS